MSLLRTVGWSIVEIGVGIVVGYGVHALTGDLFTALVWCAVAASLVGYYEGVFDA
jgi:hypothetical protein